MRKPGKALRRSARAVERLSRKASERADQAQAALAAGTYDADMFAKHAAGQAMDVLGFWSAVLGMGADGPPAVFIEIVVTGVGGAIVAGEATVELDEPVANVALLQRTPLTAPAASIAAASVAIASVPPAATPVETIKITVGVPNNQAQSLYRGFLTIGPDVQVEINVSVRT